MTDTTPHRLSGNAPGLWYVHRDGSTISYLSSPTPPTLERPESDVLHALLRYVLDMAGGLQCPSE